MKKLMKVHLYDVMCSPESAKLENLITELNEQPVASREVDIGAARMRLEAAKEIDEHGKRRWLLDFANARYDHGPGRVAPGTPIADFDLAENEGFGEETAALYDIKKKRLLVQYNHYGPRAHSIAKYLSVALPGFGVDVSLLSKLDMTAETRLAQSKGIRTITTKVASVVADDRSSGVSVKRAAELARSMGGQTITITIAAPRGGLLASDAARSFIKKLQNMVPSADGEPSPVETLKAKAVPTDDGPAAEIDLLLPRLSLELGNLSLGPGLRYTRESRWAALRQACATWQTLP